MNIGVDMDEVLAELLEAYLKYHNHNYDTKVQKKDMFSYSFEEVLGGTHQENKQRILDFFKSDFFHKIKPVSGSLKAIPVLAQNHQLSIITARPHIIRLQTEEWLQQHFPDCFHSINLTNQWHGEGTKHLKSKVGREHKIEMMIDDSLNHVQDCASQGIYTLLADFQYPWNKSVTLPKNSKRVHSWKEIVEEITEYEKYNNRTRITQKI